jgi:hypothetical protein
MVMESPITVVIGGKTLLCPPMPFYCLERAWPHIRTMGRLGNASHLMKDAELQVRAAITTQEHQSATENLETAAKVVEDMGADIIGQTRVALQIIACALALDSNPPSYDDLAKLMQPHEIAGVHLAVTELMNASGLMTEGNRPSVGEALAAKTGQSLNGSSSSLN